MKTEPSDKDIMQLIAAWQMDRSDDMRCPKCTAGTVVIEDRSARPHCEWYILSCANCAFEHTLYIPLGSRPPQLD